MKETFDQRKTELEIAAKNTIVEIHIIKAKMEDITKVLRSKEKQFEDIDAALRELGHLRTLFKVDEEGSDPD